jgi:hypothetical protein
MWPYPDGLRIVVTEAAGNAFIAAPRVERRQPERGDGGVLDVAGFGCGKEVVQ